MRKTDDFPKDVIDGRACLVPFTRPTHDRNAAVKRHPAVLKYRAGSGLWVERPLKEQNNLLMSESAETELVASSINDPY